MECPAIQFDDETQVGVLQVTKPGTTRTRRRLPVRCRQPVRPFDFGQVFVFECRARPVADIGEHTHDQRAGPQPNAALRDGKKSIRGGSSPSDGRRQCRDDAQTVRSPSRYIDDRLIESNAGRRQIRLHIRDERGSMVDHNPSSRSDPPAGSDRDMDGVRSIDLGSPRRTQRGFVTQGRWVRAENRTPCALAPRQRTVVRDVNAGIYVDPAPTPQAATHIRGVDSAGQYLPPADDPVLQLQQFGDASFPRILPHTADSVPNQTIGKPPPVDNSIV